MLVLTKGKKEENCQFLLYVGNGKGKTDICQFFVLFFYEPFPNLNPIIQIDHFEMRSVIWGDRSRIGSDQYVNSI